MIYLNKNAWHVSLNKFVYGDRVRLDKNLCPYFWKTLFAIIFLPATVIGYFIRSILNLFPKEVSGLTNTKIWNEDRHATEVVPASNIAVGVMSLLFFGLIFTVVSTLLLLIVTIIVSEQMIVTLSILGAILITIGLYKSYDIWGNMVIGIYKGICPSVEWFDKNSE